MVKPFQRPLFLLTASDELEKILRQVIDRPFSLFRIPDWRALKLAILEAPQTAVCFADAIWGSGPEKGLAETLRDIAQEFPLLAVVGCIPIETRPDVDLLISLESWGLADILDLNRELTEAAVARRLQEVQNVWAQRLLKRTIQRPLSSRARSILEGVATVAAEGGHVPALANALGVDERTIPRWCASAGVPHARRLFSWIRLLLAADLLDDSGRSIESVARSSGYSSAPSLKSATKQFTGFSPTDLRERGAFQTVASEFRTELRATREALHKTKNQHNSWFN